MGVRILDGFGIEMGIVNEIKVADIIARITLSTEVYAHTLRVVGSVRANIASVAYLHDVVEDSEVTLQDLSDLGFSGHTVHSVDALTRRASETYAEYIVRLKGSDHVAALVKDADLIDHLGHPETLKASLKARYERAVIVLTAP